MKIFLLILALFLIPGCAPVIQTLPRGTKVTIPKTTVTVNHPKPKPRKLPPICKEGEEVCIPIMGFEGMIMPGMASNFNRIMIKAAGEPRVDAIVVVINSGGGFISSAKRMIQAVQEFPKPVHCVVENVAGSAAFWLLQTCDHRIALNTAELLAHEPMTVPPMGRPFTRSSLKGTLERLNVLNDLIAETVAPRMGMTVQAYKRRIARGDWHMSARGALKNNAVDRVVPSIKAYRKKLKRHLYSVDRH